MNISDAAFYFFISALPIAAVVGFLVRAKVQNAFSDTHWRSLPAHYAFYASLFIVLPGAITFFFVSALHQLTLYTADGFYVLVIAVLFSILGGLYSLKNVRPTFCARESVERIIRYFLVSAALISILTTVGIVLAIVFEAIHFFKIVSLWEF
ncbi:MAG: hypothetical protein Q9M44_03850, partial [Ghiorsea sp.]|nr:hypothetical protein [Ghiorsea sp.]